MGCKRLGTDFLFFLEVETSEERARTQKKDLNVYPFGLKHKGYNNTPIAGQRDHKYGFGGKEEQSELGLDWIDITARNYDPALGRWMNLDPLAEQMRRHSPYNYAFDNPVYWTDPDGMAPSDDYTFNNDTGRFTKIRNTGDEFDVVYQEKKDGSQGKKIIGEVKSGILNDGSNFKTKANLIETSEKLKEADIESFVFALATIVNKEMTTDSWIMEGSEDITAVTTTAYGDNKSDKVNPLNSSIKEARLRESDEGISKRASSSHVHLDSMEFGTKWDPIKREPVTSDITKPSPEDYIIKDELGKGIRTYLITSKGKIEY